MEIKMDQQIIIWAAAFIYDVAAVKKIDGVPPPRFNLVFQVSALFHHEWHRFNLVLKCSKPTSFLESPHLVLISFCRRNQHFHKPCLTPHLVVIIVNKCSCSYDKWISAALLPMYCLEMPGGIYAWWYSGRIESSTSSIDGPTCSPKDRHCLPVLCVCVCSVFL